MGPLSAAVLLAVVPLASPMASAPASGEVAPVRLPAGLPEALTLVVERDGRPRALVLERASVRAAGFALLERGADGVARPAPAPPVATYRGRVTDAPGSLVAASLHGGGVVALVVEEEGRWAVEPLVRDPRGVRSAATPAAVVAHRSYDAPAGLAADRCLALDAPGGAGRAPSTLGAGAGCLTVAEVAFDADHEAWLRFGATTALEVEAMLNAANAMYVADVALEHRITQTVVQTAEPDPYSSFDPGGLLDQHRNHWNTVQAGVPRDLAHLVTGKELDGSVIGLAYVGVVCNQAWAYGLTQVTFDFGTHVDILAHELGHNWGAPHCLDPGGTCVMCGGGALGFGPITEALVLDFAAAAGCLGADVGAAAAVAPNARADHAVVDGATALDVLGNDLDGNCDPLHVAAFDATSALGGTVTLSPGTGPGGRDELVYAPPGPLDALDTFTYRAGDGTGLDAPATVSLWDGVPDLAARWALDEAAGIFLFDASGAGQVGTYVGLPALGEVGAAAGTQTAVGFDGADDGAVIPNYPGLAELDRNLTVAAWIRPDAFGGTRRIVSHEGSWSFGLTQVGLGMRLLFTTHQVQDYVSAPVGLPLGAWTHVAASFDLEHEVRFYVDGVLVDRVDGPLPARLPSEGWWLASYDGSVDHFAGALDDVQLWRGALTAPQVRCLVEASQGGPGLGASPATVSASLGGAQDLALCTLDAAHGGALHLLAGSLAGTAPGLVVGGVPVPLNPDAYLVATLAAPGLPPLEGSFGSLNPWGFAAAAFALPPASDPALAGLQAHHAWAVLDPATFAVLGASGAEAVLVVP